MRIDKMVTNLQRNDIEQFLHDVREYFIASLDTSEYENTSNMFHLTEAEQTANLLHRCNELLAQYTRPNQIVKNAFTAKPLNGSLVHKNGIMDGHDARQANGDSKSHEQAAELEEDATYLDMSAANKKQTGSRECMDLNTSTDSDKTFRCSTTIKTIVANKQKEVGGGSGTGTEKELAVDKNDKITTTGSDKANKIDDAVIVKEDVAEDSDDDDDDEDDDERQIYDICLVSQLDDDDDDNDETQKVITNTALIDCPYVELPAGHLAIQQSSKYGQLQKLEKRLFFDQSKKCYCGILNDWLLIYADGPTSSTPSLTLHLKNNGIEIEHYGEGKRRDVCFQITTPDPNKKFVFQATNEVDAKEWIHAIEAAIRNDSAVTATATAAASGFGNNSTRKLPTPPVMKKLTFISANASDNNNTSHSTTDRSDCIYEEPTPLYAVHEPTELLLVEEKTTTTTKKTKKKTKDDIISSSSRTSTTSCGMQEDFEYDIPKSPPQPVLPTTGDSAVAGLQPDSESCGLLNLKTTPTKSITAIAGVRHSPPQSARPEKPLDFQAKVKDVHNKLSSQLTAGLSPDRYRNQALNKKSYSPCSSEMEFIAFSNESAASAAATTPPSKNGKDQKKPKKSDTPNAAIGGSSPRKNSSTSNCEKSSKNWFLNRLNKTTSSTRNPTSSSSALSSSSSSILSHPNKCKHSEKENLLNSLEMYDQCESGDSQPLASNNNGTSSSSSNPASPILLKGDGAGHAGKSKVNMIINQLEASGHLATMFSMDTFTTFCGGGNNHHHNSSNDCNNYEPIMTMSTPTSLMKKV